MGAEKRRDSSRRMAAACSARLAATDGAIREERGGYSNIVRGDGGARQGRLRAGRRPGACPTFISRMIGRRQATG
jgi:hypothetical protein